MKQITSQVKGKQRGREYFLTLFEEALTNKEVSYVTWRKDISDEVELPWDTYIIVYLPKEEALKEERAIIAKREGEKPMAVELLLPEKEHGYITGDWYYHAEKELGMALMLGWYRKPAS